MVVGGQSRTAQLKVCTTLTCSDRRSVTSAVPPTYLTLPRRSFPISLNGGPFGHMTAASASSCKIVGMIMIDGRVANSHRRQMVHAQSIRSVTRNTREIGRLWDGGSRDVVAPWRGGVERRESKWRQGGLRSDRRSLWVWSREEKGGLRTCGSGGRRGGRRGGDGWGARETAAGL